MTASCPEFKAIHWSMRSTRPRSYSESGAAAPGGAHAAWGDAATSLSARAGIAIAGAVATLVDADIGIVGGAAEHFAGCRTNDRANAGTNQRTSSAATGGSRAHHGATKSANSCALLGSGAGRHRQAGRGNDQNLMHRKPSGKYRRQECTVS